MTERKPQTVVHLAATKRPWLYTLKTGEEVSYPKMGGGMAVHQRHPEKLWLLGLCAELNGQATQFREPSGVENLVTRTLKKITCSSCRVALDRALEAGRVTVLKRGRIEVAQEFEPVPSVTATIGQLNGWFKRVYADSVQELLNV